MPVLEVRRQPDQIDKYKKVLPQMRDFVIGQDGVSPSIGIRKPETQTQRDLSEISLLQNQFNRALGHRYDQEDMLQRSYNPVIDCWWIERLRREGDQDGEKAYSRQIHKNLETNLKERFQVGDNVIRYDINGRNLYSELFPNESFSDVLQRGVEYRLQHGTPEAEREEAERMGFERIRDRMTDPSTPIGTRMTSFSPKGIAKKSAYDKNVVDEYKLAQENHGKRFVNLTRRVIDFKQADYYAAALKLGPNFFEDYDGRPVDAWLLSHPIEGVVPDLQQHLTGISSDTFAKIWQDNTLQRMVDNYKGWVLNERFDPRELSIAFNAILNQADRLERAVLGGVAHEQSVYTSPDAMQRTIRELGLMNPVIRGGGGGCPPNKGINIANAGDSFLLGGSVAVFAGGAGGSAESDDKGALTFKCNKGHWNMRPRGQLIPNCLTCGDSVAC